MSRFRDLLANEYVRSAVLLVIIIVSIAAFWFGLKAYLRTDYPLLAVASGSMVPTLNEGDLIIVQGVVNADTIVAEMGTGDVIVFHKPGDPELLIVHRAVGKWEDGDVWKFNTRGDANSGDDHWIRPVEDTDIVGKVTWTIPYLGHIPLFVHTRNGQIIIVILITILVLLEFVIPSIKKMMEPEQPKEESDLSSIESL